MVTRRNANQLNAKYKENEIDVTYEASAPPGGDFVVPSRGSPGNVDGLRTTGGLLASALPSSSASSSSRIRFARRTMATILGLTMLATSMLSTILRMQSTLEDSRTRESMNENALWGRHGTEVQRLATKEKKIPFRKFDDPNSPLDHSGKITEKMKKKAKLAEAGGVGSNTTEEPLEVDRVYDDPPVYEALIADPTVRDFDASLPGVIVTKIQGPPHLRALKQMLCLLTKAYNDKVNHDIIVFSSEAINATSLHDLRQTVAPAKLIFEVDNPGLQQMVDRLPPDQKTHLLERCSVQSSSELTWYTKCTEVRSHHTMTDRLAYNWQAEFRALHLWTHPLLKPYKYMMWMDSDAFCTRVWDRDPFAAMARHDLALLFDHFPQGAARGSEIPAVTRQVFNRTICGISMENGTLVPRDGKCYGKIKTMIKQVHGFFHVSNLDFYRSEKVMEWNRAMIGDNKFSRLFDDQIGITIPAALLAGNRSRDMRSLGLRLRVFHNYVIDGEMKDWRGYFVPWWRRNADTTFPEANGHCLVDISA